jgi:peptidylprolyl isomerase
MPTLPNGLIIEDTLEGEGDPCPKGAVITIHYRGTLMNGKEFDSSYPGVPVTFPLRRLITGWQEGIPGMKCGGKRKLTIPWQMAYGEDGAPPDIPGRANLIFEIELFEFK